MKEPHPINEGLRLAATIAVKHLFDFIADSTERQKLRRKIFGLITTAYHYWSQSEQRSFLALCAAARASPDYPPPELLERLADLLALAGLDAWAAANAPDAYAQNPRFAADWLTWAKSRGLNVLREAARRFAADRSDDSDQRLLGNHLHTFLKERYPMVNFDFDPRGLPAKFLDGTPRPADVFRIEVEKILKDSVGLVPGTTTDNNTIAEIKGTLLLNELFDPKAFGFRDAITDAWTFGLQTTRRLTPNADGSFEATNREMFDKVVDEITKIRPPNTAGGPVLIFFQELAFVAKYAIDNAVSIPIDHPNFNTQVRIGLQKYVEGQPPSDSFDLPLLTAEGGTDVSIEPPNIEAVSIIYTALQVDPKLRMIHVVDRITELFMNGLLPIGPGNAGKALDDYYWNADERLSEPARNAVYARVLGAPGADVSKEVVPNRDFDNLFNQFVSSLAEYDRQQRVADLFENRGRSLALTGENVRKKGRDLAGNVSLRGWGGTLTVARRLKQHILTALSILEQQEIQKVYGVSDPYQVIERVALNEFGQAPNIVKYKTMADAGRIILRLLAKYADAWSVNTGHPLFQDPTAPDLGSDIPPEDERALMLQAQNIIAVNGMSDEMVGKLAAPSDTTYAPSVPAFGAVSPIPFSGNGSGDLVAKLQQMVAAGNAPSVDQLKQLLPGMKM